MGKDAPFVIFGAGENSHKGVICYPSRNTGGWAAKIVQLADSTQTKPGQQFSMEDVEGEYFTLYFCTKDSIREFIAALQGALEEWEKGGKTNETAD